MFDVEKDLKFEMVEQKPKTKVYHVWNAQQRSIIGWIKWNPHWRHYCFFPDDETVFSDRCLIKIGRFVEDLNNKHKKAPIPPAPNVEQGSTGD